MNAPAVAFHLILAGIDKGGATFDQFGNDASDFPGYVVGGKVPTLVFESKPAYADVIGWIRENESGFYGVWVDSETGFWHFDAVDLLGDKFEAIRMAAERGELAIWDGKAGEEIRLPESHDYDPECVCIACEAVRMEDWEYDPDCNCETCQAHREGAGDGEDVDTLPVAGEPDEWAGHYDESGY